MFVFAWITARGVYAHSREHANGCGENLPAANLQHQTHKINITKIKRQILMRLTVFIINLQSADSGDSCSCSQTVRRHTNSGSVSRVEQTVGRRRTQCRHRLSTSLWLLNRGGLLPAPKTFFFFLLCIIPPPPPPSFSPCFVNSFRQCSLIFRTLCLNVVLEIGPDEAAYVSNSWSHQGKERFSHMC